MKKRMVMWFLIVCAFCTLLPIGTLATEEEGVEPEKAALTASNSMTQMEFEAELEKTSYRYYLRKEVILESDLVVTNLCISDGGSLIIPDGVTLTWVAQTSCIDGGSLFVKSGGTLVIEGEFTVSTGTIIFEENSRLDNQGEFSVGAYVNYTMNGIVSGNSLDIAGTEITQNEFVAAIEKAIGKGEDYYTLQRKLTLTEDFVLDYDVYNAEYNDYNGFTIRIDKSGSITVPADIQLRFEQNNYTYVNGGTIEVKNGGMLDVRDYLFLQEEGSLIVDKGGSITVHEHKIDVDMGHAQVSGVDPQLISAEYNNVNSCSELEIILDKCEQYYSTYIQTGKEITLENDIVVPENTMLSLWYAISIPQGIDVINYGRIDAYKNVTIGSNSKIDNGGLFFVYPKYLIIETDGVVIGNPLLYRDSMFSTVIAHNLEELKLHIDLLAGLGEHIGVFSPITLPPKFEIPEDVYLFIGEGGELVVPEGGTFAVNSQVQVKGGKLIVGNGATFDSRGALLAHLGSVEIAPDAILNNSGVINIWGSTGTLHNQGTLYMLPGGRIIGTVTGNQPIEYETPHEHSYTPVDTPPTCTEQGFTTYTCACGDSYLDDYVAANGHRFEEWFETKAPTWDEMGEERRECANCDHYETRMTDKLPEAFVASGICGENLTWELDKNGTMTISGSGTMEFSLPRSAESAQVVPWAVFREYIIDVIIHEGVTSIADYAFTDCENLKSVTIYGSVNAVGTETFANCQNLSEITFMGVAPAMGQNCFIGVTATAYYPAGDESWTADTFVNCGGDIKLVAAKPFILLGDATGDGVIDFSDAVLVLEYSAFLVDDSQLSLSACDVNGDGFVDFSDAVLILEYSAFLITEFPAAK